MSTATESHTRVVEVLRDIEKLAFQLRSQIAASPPAEVDRFDAALARLRAAKPRIEDLAGSGGPVDLLGERA
jgi:hypothetical protein